MRLPNKVTSFKQSTFSLFIPILEELSHGNFSPVVLYEKVGKNADNIAAFVDALDCLFALKKIELLPNEVIRYVK